MTERGQLGYRWTLNVPRIRLAFALWFYFIEGRNGVGPMCVLGWENSMCWRWSNVQILVQIALSVIVFTFIIMSAFVPFQAIYDGIPWGEAIEHPD